MAYKAEMPRTAHELRADALEIWRAGVAAVDSVRLVREAVRIEGSHLHVADESFDLGALRRIVVVGAGKAGAGMAAGLEQALGDDVLRSKQVAGWINVPADCVRPLQAVHLHAARPPGSNEPTAEGVAGAEEILRLASTATADDLCIALVSGGASALLPAPVAAITLADKLAVTRLLSGAGANIAELNTVRKQLSRIKGGGLLRACRAGHLATLVISDVLGDPLDIIASGPTVPDTSTPADALAILERFGGVQSGVPQRILDYLAGRADATREPPTCTSEITVIGNNAVAVDAAGLEAERRGYSHAMIATRTLEGAAEEVGRDLARMALTMREQEGPDCLISGGEPVVRLVPEGLRGAGGRNQQLVLAALEALRATNAEGIVLLSGGTDGEDGPTDAAGAFLDAEVIADAQALDPSDYLRRNDAYHFFAPLGALIKTGPTHTNVCDVRVVLVDRP